ncbi:MAG: ABC transporter ATP-binding protein [Candidatus Kapabacteria bacterium]|nr:ABC transporter ATP-binding protein [Candidatus Kapabacteria bacterium]
MEIIKVSNVHKIYNSSTVAVNALKGVSLSVNKGEFLVIAGESGSGKTTLLNIIGTLDIPSEGGVVLEGQDISKKSKGELSDIRLNKLGFVFQAFNLIPVLTAMENIEFTMMLLGIPESVRRQRTLLIMEELGIAELADKKPNQMSGGQQQRVAVARAIVHNPLIVLADEPTANLDSKTGEHLLDLMQKMNREKNITFVFSSHDNKVISKASRLITLKDGLILSGK